MRRPSASSASSRTAVAAAASERADRLVRQLGEDRQAGHEAAHDRLEERPVGRAPADDPADRPAADVDRAMHLDRGAAGPRRAGGREDASVGVLDGERDAGSARSVGGGAVEWREDRSEPGDAEPFDGHRRRPAAQNASSAVARSGWMWNSRSRPVRWRTRSTAGWGPASWTAVWVVPSATSLPSSWSAPQPDSGIDRRLSVHDPHDRAERDEARAGQEGQVRQIEQEVAGPGGIQLPHLVHEVLEVRGVELAVEGHDRDRDSPGGRFDRRRQRHLALLRAFGPERPAHHQYVAASRSRSIVELIGRRADQVDAHPAGNAIERRDRQVRFRNAGRIECRRGVGQGHDAAAVAPPRRRPRSSPPCRDSRG